MWPIDSGEKRGDSTKWEQLRVAAYCRVSTDKEDQANSFEGQKRYFREYIQRHPGWSLTEIFADEGVSGTSVKHRTAFQRMIAGAENGSFDLIVTKEISRFARNTLDSIYYTRSLKRLGVGVLFMNDNINTLDPDAELRLTIMSSIAQEESRKTSERVKWGQRRRMEQGVVFGHSLLGYDVRDGALAVEPEGAETVKRIFQKFTEEGKGTHTIARELFEEGVPAPASSRWTATAVLRVLRNEKYCGDLAQKKTYTPDYLTHEKKRNDGREELVVLREHHEPIVSREAFDRAQCLLNSRARDQTGKAKHSGRHGFSGKVSCGCCGASCVARYKTRKNGTQYRSWRCYEAVRHGAPHVDSLGNPQGCTAPGIREEELEALLLRTCGQLPLNREKLREQLLQALRTTLSRAARGPAQVASGLEQERKRLIDLYLHGDISREEFRAAREQQERLAGTGVNAGNAALEDRLAALSEALDAILGNPQAELCLDLLQKLVVYGRERVDVYLTGVDAPWRYSAEGTKP